MRPSRGKNLAISEWPTRTDGKEGWADYVLLAGLWVVAVVDRGSLDVGQFKADGGFARLNKVFDGQLESLLGELAEEVWKDVG